MVSWIDVAVTAAKSLLVNAPLLSIIVYVLYIIRPTVGLPALRVVSTPPDVGFHWQETPVAP